MVSSEALGRQTTFLKQTSAKTWTDLKKLNMRNYFLKTMMDSSYGQNCVWSGA